MFNPSKFVAVVFVCTAQIQWEAHSLMKKYLAEDQRDITS